MSAIAIIKTIARNNKPTIAILLQGYECGAAQLGRSELQLVYQVVVVASIGEMSQQI